MNSIEKTVRQFHESWDLRDPDRGAAVIAPDCQFEDVARGESQIGPDGYRADYHCWRAAFPDGEVKVVNVITGSDGPDGWAVVEFLNRGTQTGVLHSSLGEFPPSGRPMEVRYCSVMRVQDGKVVEGRDYSHSASNARQLGLVD
jgi:ketosteroid isomerase-like protein